MLLELIRRLTLLLNRLSMVFGFVIGMGYTYHAMPGLYGLIGGFLTSIAHLILMWITTNNALGHSNLTNYPSAYLIISIAAALLSSISVFIHTYYSMMLLAPFLPVSYPVIFGLSLLIASCCTISNLLFAVIQISRPYYRVPTLLEQRTLAFSNFTSLLHTLIILGHIWSIQSNAFSFYIGVILSLCDLLVLYLFNYHLLTTIPSPRRQAPESFCDIAQRHAYIGLSVICILGSKIGSCIMHYQGTLLLGLALGLPLSFVTGMAISTAAVATLAGLLFSGTQAYELYQRIFPSLEDSPQMSPHNTLSLT